MPSIIRDEKKHQLYKKNRDSGLYMRYMSARKRCNYIKHDHYKWYGARGIKFEWNSYPEFKKDMYDSYIAHVKKHGRENTTIERKDNTKGYNKQNCTWATPQEQHLTQGGPGRSNKKFFALGK